MAELCSLRVILSRTACLFGISPRQVSASDSVNQL